MDDDFHWPRPLPAPDFIMVPKLVHRDIMRHLSGAEFKVFYCLLVHAYEWGRPHAELSILEIVTEAGVGRGTAQDAVKALADAGLIAIVRHTTREHGHEANTYRLEITDDPRYIARDAIPKTGIAGGENRDSLPADRERSRARSTKGKNTPKEDTSTAEKYFTGPHALCRLCNSSPHMPDCTLASAE